MTSRIILRTLKSTSSNLLRLRPLTSLAAVTLRQCAVTNNNVRSYSTRQTMSSLNDPNPNWSNRPPKETILLDGCDFEHWLVVVDKPEGEPTRDEIIENYINTLAKVVGSYDEARMKIYSVSTRCYYAFGALVSEEDSYKLKELPGVRWVLPDSYLDVQNKDYGGEPFIDGKAVPYDPKYHEEWIRNNARANERNRRNDRPRNFDRSRNFERRRENMQTNRGPPGGPPPSNMGGPPSNMGGPPPNMGEQPPNLGIRPQGGNMGGPPPNNWNNGPPQHYGGGPPHMGGGMPPQNNMSGGMRPQNMAGGMPNSAPPNYQQQGQYGPNNGGMPYQSSPGPNNYPPNVGGGNPYQNQNVSGRDMPPSNYE
ncbi:hypothetical protein CTI12_AA275500 [Artemisia annua]|uniref:MORF/ORRM1/DAG-like MORF domain-containing protein n=1 Tax=Artemisia annua TaxID=35608 RepID=A0A2U1NDP7_ARTAN|nr:hypothetical protein CTI12_AA275500 [Artemisia annua]